MPSTAEIAEPQGIPSSAGEMRSGSENAGSAMKSDTVKPI